MFIILFIYNEFLIDWLKLINRFNRSAYEYIICDITCFKYKKSLIAIKYRN